MMKTRRINPTRMVMRRRRIDPIIMKNEENWSGRIDQKKIGYSNNYEERKVWLTNPNHSNNKANTNQMNGTTTVPEQAIRKSFDERILRWTTIYTIITNCKCQCKGRWQHNLNTAREEMVPTLDTRRKRRRLQQQL